MKDTQPLSASDCPSLSLMGEQPLFEMVALAAHVRPTLSIARNDSVAGDDEWNLAEEEEQRKFDSTENNSNIMKEHFLHRETMYDHVFLCLLGNDLAAKKDIFSI